MTLSQHLWSIFESYLADIETNRMAFNPWISVDPKFDVVDADAIRRNNLKTYLSLFDKPPRMLAIGEAPGWRGCRFSGVPFTSEAQLVDEAAPFRGKKSSSGSPYTETSARVVWSVLKPHAHQVFLWNAFPIHPHRDGNALSNRNPMMKELKAQSAFLKRLSEILDYPRVIAIGRKAEALLSLCDLSPTYVRHPSHGGGPAFAKGMRQMLGD